MMFMKPPAPLPPPSLILPGSLSLAVRPFPLFLFPFASSPSVSFSRPPPPAVSDHPSSFRWTPPVDSSSGRRPMSSPGLQRPVCRFVSNLCGWWYLAWVWVEGRGRYRPPRLSLSPLTRRQASPGKCVFLAPQIYRSLWVPALDL